MKLKPDLCKYLTSLIHTGLTLAAQDISSEDDVASLGTPDDVEELESTTGTPGSGVGSDVSTTASSSSTSRLDRVLAQLAELKVSKELEKKEDLEKSSRCVVVDLSDDDDDDDDDDFGKKLETMVSELPAEPTKPSGATPTGGTRSQRIANLLLEAKTKRLANGTNKGHKDTKDAVLSTSVPGTSLKAPMESRDEKCQNPYVLPNYVPSS